MVMGGITTINVNGCVLETQLVRSQLQHDYNTIRFSSYSLSGLSQTWYVLVTSTA